MTTPAEYKAYIERLKNPDMKDDGLFRELVSYGLRINGLLDEDMARYFDVSRTTVNRWKSGANAPHPALRKHVYALLKNRAVKLLDREAETAGRH